MRIGFVGLGMMGFPMVENLAGGGEAEVLAFDRDRGALVRLSTLPSYGDTLSACEDLAALARCDVVITMLPNSAITSRIIEGGGGETGLSGILARGATIVDMGSSDPMETLRLAPLLEAAGIAFVDAPVSGAVAKARAGTLAIMAGADDDTFARVEPILSRMGSTLIRCGAVGSAHAMKTLNNYVYAAGLLAVSEALAIAERLNLDASIFADVLNASSGRNVASETKLKQFIIPRDFAGGFALALQAKDLATATKLKEVTGLDAQLLGLCDAVWRRALEQAEPGADNTTIYQHVARRTAAVAT
ncbi:NAD(P)-dependent oxidoreductase [Bosea sp. RCC_152_1]|uniref:NAD(P)-dependent oxidoreductase n=1 Tax=Bosea sp. RCC_152_1 TaxID=3239228 RepID=UPI0035247813